MAELQIDPEALKYAHELFKKDGYNGDVNSFKSLISKDNEALDYSYNLFKKDGYNGSVDDYKSLVIDKPVKKKEPSQQGSQPISPEKVWGSSSQPKSAYDTLVTDQAKQVGASVTSAGKPKPKPKADGAEWTGGAGSFTIGVNQEYKNRADNYIKSTRPQQSDIDKAKQDVDSEWNNQGIWNNVKRYAGSAAKIASSIGSLTSIAEGITGGISKMMSDAPGSEFEYEKKMAKKQLLLESEQAKKDGGTPPIIDNTTIAQRTKANLLEKKINSITESKERDYLIKAERNVDASGLSEKDKIERFDTQKVNTLRHIDRVELQKQNILRPAIEESIKDLNQSILKANNFVKAKTQVPPELLEEINQKQQELKLKEKITQDSYNKFLSNRKELGTFEHNLDVVRRDYNWGRNLVNTFGATTIELMSGMAAIPGYSANIVENIVGKNVVTEAFKKQSKWESELYGKEAEELRNEIAKPISIEDIDLTDLSRGVSDFGDWFRNTFVASQAPILGATLAGGAGFAAIGSASAGNAYTAMQKEVEAGTAEYTPWQLAAIPAAHGGIDSVQAIVESNLLKGAGRTLASASVAQRELIAEGMFKPIATKLIKAIPHSNAWFAGITMSKNILTKYGEGKEDVQLTDGLADSIAMATAMGGMLPVFSHVISEKIVKPFRLDNKISKLSDSILVLENELKDTSIDPIIRTEKESLLDNKRKAISTLLVKQVKDIKSLSNEQFTEVLDINKEQSKLRDRAAKAKEAADPNDTKSTQDILDNLAGEFKVLEQRRVKILQKGPSMLLEQLNNPEYVTELKTAAENKLVKEAKDKGKTEVKFTDDEISREAITMHNEKIAIKKGYEDYNKRVAEQGIKPAEEKVWYYNEDAKRGPIESAPETLPEGYTSAKKIENSVELERWKNQTEITTETITKEKEVEQLREQERLDKEKVDPNDKEKLDEIYDKYDKLISPLLREIKGAKAEVTPTEKTQGAPDVVSEPIDLEVPKPKVEAPKEEVEAEVEGETLLDKSTKSVLSIKDGESFDLPDGSKIERTGDTFKWNRGENGTREISREDVIRITNNTIAESKAGSNIEIRNYNTETVKGEELKVGDVYVRDINGTRYVYRLLEKPTVRSGPGAFFGAKVEILSIGKQPIEVLTPEPGSKIGKVFEGEQREGGTVTDYFKSPSKTQRSFGKVKKINNWEEVSKPTEKAKVAEVVEPKTAEVVEPKKVDTSKIDKVIKEHEDDVDYYTRQIEDIQEEIKNEKSNAKEDIAKLKEDIAKVKQDKSLSKEERTDQVEDLKAEIEDLKDNQESNIESYNDDLAEAKIDLKKSQKKLDKANLDKTTLLEKEVTLETKKEQLTKEVDDASKALKDAYNAFKTVGFALDPKQKAAQDLKNQAALNKALIDYGVAKLKKGTYEFSEFVKDLKAEGLKVSKEFAKDVYERIKSAHAVVSKKESGDRLGIKRTPAEEQAIQAKIDKAYELGAKEQKVISKEIEKALKLEAKETEAQAKDALAAQKEVLGIEKAEALSEQGKKFKEQKESIKQSIKDKIEKSKDAIKNINQIVAESLPLDKLSKVQVKSILNNAMKIFTYANVENGVSNFIDHVDKVINNIDHVRNLENLETLRKKSFQNLLKARVSPSLNLTHLVSKVLSIKPEHIPSEVMSEYTRILDKLGDNADKRIQRLISELPSLKGAELLKKQAELEELKENQIKDRAELFQMANKVMDAFQVNRNKVVELSDSYNSYIENNNLQGETFSKVVKKMEADDIITETEADLMRSNSDYYVKRKAREGKKGEVLEQRESLTDRVNQTLKSLNSPEGVEYRKNSLDRESILEANKVVGKVTKEYLDSLSDNELETVLNVLNALDGGLASASLRKVANGIDLFEREKAIKPILSDAKLKWWEGAKSTVKAAYYGVKGDKVKSSVWYHKLQGAHNNIIDTVINNLQNNELYKNTSDKASKLFGQNKTFISLKENEHVNPISNMIDKHFKGDSANIMRSNIKTTMYLIQKAHESSMNKSKDLHIKDFIETTNKNKVYDENTLKEINLIFDKFKDKDFDSERWYNEELLDVEKKAVEGFSKAYSDPEILEKAKATSYFDNGRVLDTSNPNYYPVDFVFADNSDAQIDNLIKSKTESFYNPSMKAGSLMEKVGSSGGNNKSINLTNPFKTLETYITDVSTQYHMMNETRIQNQLYNKILKDQSLSKSALELVGAMKAGNEKVVKSWLDNAYKETGFWGSVFDKRITKQLLSGFGKFAAEGAGNAINMVNHIGEVIDGIKLMNDSSLTTEQLDKVLYNIGIAQGERFIGKAISMDNSFKNQGDVNMPISRKLKMDSNMPKEYINMINNLYKRTKTKAALDQIEMLHDALRVTPDKSLSKPLILGIFNKRFQALSGELPDWNKLSSGDAEYMSNNKQFIDAAASSSNVESSLVIGSQNPYEKAGKQVMTSDSGVYAKANSFFQGYSMAQGSAFQVALKNLLYNGTISKPEASLMIAQRIASQAAYLAINKAIQKGLFVAAAGALGYTIFKDDEEEEGSIKRNIVSSAVQLGMSRTGAIGSNLAAFAFEKGSEQYGQGVLYEGEYTKGKATMFSAYDPKKTATENFMNVGMQSMGQRYVTISKGKEVVTDFQKGEWKTGMFDIAGNLGYVPLYKDINTVTNNIKYQSIPSKETAKGMTSSQQNDLEKKTIPKAIENALYNLDMADIRFYRKEISEDQKNNIIKENTKVVKSIAKVTGTVNKDVYKSARKKADERLKIRYSFYKGVDEIRKMSTDERVVYLIDAMKDMNKKGVISEDVDYELKQMIKTKLITKSEVDAASKIYNKYK